VPAERQEPGTGRLELAAALIPSAVVGAPLIVALVARMLMLSAGAPADAVAVLVFAGAFALGVLAVVLVFHRLRSRAEDRQALRVPYMILAVQIAIGAVAAMVLLFTPR
jgi:hypothetical protein